MARKIRLSSQVSDVKSSRWVSAPLVLNLVALIALVTVAVMLSQSAAADLAGLQELMMRQSFDPTDLLDRGGEELTARWVGLIQSAGAGLRL